MGALPPADLEPLCQALLCGLRQILAEKLLGLYLYGAIAFPEGGATGDIDFHAILAEPPEAAEKSAVADLHAGLARDYPPMGGELDGYYILLKDALRAEPPAHQLLPGVSDNSWALHRAHLRAGRCIVLHGPEPGQLLPAPSWPELEGALRGELDYVGAHLADAPAYCVLNLCRLIYSFQTRDVVVSKRASAAWAERRFPDWRPLIEAALRSYDLRVADEGTVGSQVAVFFRFAREEIQRVAGSQAVAGPENVRSSG
jgi:hypothetical protein